jgi:SRSO17 transposase
MEVRQEQCPAPGDLALETVREWPLWLTEVERWLRPHCARCDARHRAWASLRGLLSPVERKNGWPLAEVNGAATPYGLQPLLGRARWEADAVRAALRAYLVQSLGDPQAVLVRDETGCLNKGQQSVGGARQDSGTAGRVEHGHMGVFLADASVHGHAWLDRALSRPQGWTDDRARCQHAGVPAAQRLATKPPLARPMLQRACEAGVPATWGTGASVYGADRRLRVWLAERDHAYVMAVSGQE